MTLPRITWQSAREEVSLDTQVGKGKKGFRIKCQQTLKGDETAIPKIHMKVVTRFSPSDVKELPAWCTQLSFLHSWHTKLCSVDELISPSRREVLSALVHGCQKGSNVARVTYPLRKARDRYLYIQLPNLQRLAQIKNKLIKSQSNQPQQVCISHGDPTADYTKKSLQGSLQNTRGLLLFEREQWWTGRTEEKLLSVKAMPQG